MLRRLMVALAIAGLLVACSPDDNGDEAGQDVSIGAVTIVSHPSLDLVYEGIV